MELFKNIVTLIRLPNVLFIFLTQVLVYYKLIAPLSPTQHFNIWWFATATALISVGGYIINDYFDVKIDQINKPQKVTVEKKFRRRRILFSHIIINLFALGICTKAALQAGHLSLIFIQLACITLLVVYSSTFKRQFLIGNLVIALLSSLSVMTPWLYQLNSAEMPHVGCHSNTFYLVLYGIFAFSFTWIREVVKDIEDIKGDELLQCKTMPIVWGLQKTRWFIIGLLAANALAIVYLYRTAFEKAINQFDEVLCIGIAICSVAISILSFQSTRTAHFKVLSRLLKLVLFTGILSIYFIP